jgi:hypothetical protein
MPTGANAFRISGYKLQPEDRKQQCYMPFGRLHALRQAKQQLASHRQFVGKVLINAENR